jgi:hypothetical protein
MRELSAMGAAFAGMAKWKRQGNAARRDRGMEYQIIATSGRQVRTQNGSSEQRRTASTRK